MDHRTIGISLLLMSGMLPASEPAHADQPIRKARENAVAFSEVVPSEGDLVRMNHDFKVRNKGNETSAAAERPTRVYVLRIYAELPQTSQAVDLYVGDMPVGEYYSCKGGIFFKIYSDEALKHYYGKPIRFVFNKTEYDLGVSFPSEKETLPFSQDGEQSRMLPTLKAFLDDQGNGEGGADDK